MILVPFFKINGRIWEKNFGHSCHIHILSHPWINLFSVKNYKLWNKIEKSYRNLQILTKKFEFTKNMTNSWIEVQNVRNCTTMKTLPDLQSFRKDLQIMGHEFKKSVKARVLTHFWWNSKCWTLLRTFWNKVWTNLEIS